EPAWFGEDRVPRRVQAAARHTELAEERVGEGRGVLVGDPEQRAGAGGRPVGLRAVTAAHALASFARRRATRVGGGGCCRRRRPTVVVRATTARRHDDRNDDQRGGERPTRNAAPSHAASLARAL